MSFDVNVHGAIVAHCFKLSSLGATLGTGEKWIVEALGTAHYVLMAVTLKQVAESAGVSYQTVWRAIHNGPGILPETRESVLAAAVRLGYQRNRIAGSLRTQKSATIGLVVLDVRDAHASEITLGVEEEATRQGLSVLFANSHDDVRRERGAVMSLMEHRVDGLILSPSTSGDHNYLRKAIPKGFPLVAVNRPIRIPRFHAVLSNDQDAELAARYLITKGHTKIAGVFGDLTATPMHGRHNAFVEELSRKKLSVRPSWILDGANTAEAGRAAVHRIFNSPRRPTSLFAASSRLTEGVLYGLRDIGLRHGCDVDVVGFDLRYAGLLDPPLPVLSQPAREMGRLAVDLLVRLLSGVSVEALHRLPVSGPG
jgi:DNA-binding LacI/PurR family transcriptional regulator